MSDLHAVEVDGLRLAYETWGAPEAPPLVLLHALGEDSSDWREIAPALADRYRVYALDLRGHGRSGHPGKYSYELLCDDVLAFLDALDLDRIVLVGHSLGALTASLVAQERPDALDRLVLEEGPVISPADPPRPVPDAPGEPTPYDWRLLPAIATQRNAPDPALWERLAAITAPTLVIGGGPASHLPQQELAEVATRIPGARLVTIDAGHLVHAVRPAGFLAEVDAFLAQPGNGRRGPE
jgi:pimeloyl-ACP methyl ester carboxylesterase